MDWHNLFEVDAATGSLTQRSAGALVITYVLWPMARLWANQLNQTNAGATLGWRAQPLRGWCFSPPIRALPGTICIED